MANKFILIKPLISEKAEILSRTQSNYCFQVDKRANKLEIKKAVEDMYSVAVVSVKTLVVPGKAKSRNTKSGVLKGRKPSYKKAYVIIGHGEQIDFFGGN
jgi:large subunit ribosomal protein L23